MELHRYDVIEVELKYRNGNGSVYKKKRPYVIVGNEYGTRNSPMVIVMPLTHITKKQHLPVHECLHVDSDNGLHVYSMIAGEQPQTIDKTEVIRKLGRVTDNKQRNAVNKVCYNTFFYREHIQWGEVLA